MKRPFIFVAVPLAAAAVAAFTLTADAQVYPYPTPTTTTTAPGTIPSGRCEVQPAYNGDEMLLVIECGISDTSTRTYVEPVDLEMAQRFVALAEFVFDLDAPHDGVTVH